MLDTEPLSMTAIEVSNIGGITDASVELGSDVTILVGRNATNRTSLLQAMRVALGSDHTPLRSDAKSGDVTLSIQGDAFDRELVRENGTIRTGGEPYLEDPAVADLFAFLLEDNPARRAIERGDDLREVLLRPVDVDKIEARIRSLREEREQLKTTIDDLEETEGERERLVERREAVEDELDSVTGELSAVREELEGAETLIEGEGAGDGEIDEQVEDLR